MTDLTVAKIIGEHLGGLNRVARFTGAKNFVGDDKSLTFSLPGNAKNKINRVTIVLNGKDLYDVRFWRVWGRKLTEISTVTDIYFDMLVDTFETETGLFLSF